MRHHHHGAPLMVQILEQIQHPPFIFLIQIAGRFIGEDNRRLVHQRPGNTHPLLLAAGKLAG